MIPKKIHYCWFGRGSKPKLAEKCIASWKKFCPGYEIIEWNEDNFDLNRNEYTRWCYDNKKYAFLSDYVRLAVVAEHGGIYFDTDVELLKTPDDLLQYEAFFGFETMEYVNTGEGFGAEKQHPIVQAMIQEYSKLKQNTDGGWVTVGCPTMNTNVLELLGLIRNGKMQRIGGALVLPNDYLNPYDTLTGRLHITENTYSIHWYSGSALSKGAIFRSKLTKPFHRFLGNNCFRWLKK